MIRSLFIVCAISMVAVFVACGDNGGNQMDADPFDTLQMCFDEHHNHESFPVDQAIVICCLDHPIAGVHPSCGNTAAECVAKLTGSDSVHNLMGSDVGSADIQQACTDYQTQKGM